MKILLLFLLFSQVQSNLINGRCSPGSCENGSICNQVKSSHFICHCDSLHFGLRCEFRRCEEGDSDPACQLAVDCTGPDCTSDDICGRVRPCQNGGICTNTDVDFHCACPLGYGGKRCESRPIAARGLKEEAKAEEKAPRTMTDVNLIVLVRATTFVAKVDEFLSSLARKLRTSVWIRKSEGEMDVFHWNSRDGEGPRVHFGPRNDARFEYQPVRGRRSNDNTLQGVLVVIQIDLSDCSRECYSDASQVAVAIAAADAKEPLIPGMKIQSDNLVKKDVSAIESDVLSPLVIIGVILIVLAALGVLALGVKRRYVVEAPVWTPPTEKTMKEVSSNNFYSSNIVGFNGYHGFQNLSADSKLPAPVMKKGRVSVEMPASSPLELAAIGEERITPEMRCFAGMAGRNERTPLHWLALNSVKSSADILADCNLLLSFGIDVNALDQEGNTALHYACRNARVSLAKRLLEGGADPLLDNELLMTPLHIAAQHFDDLCIEALLSHNKYKDASKVDLVDKEDRTALMLYAANSASSIKGIEMLLKAGADINFPGDKKRSHDFKGRSALHYAAMFNTDNAKMIATLISKNANKDAQDVEDASPLWWAVYENNFLAVDELLKIGASLDLADHKDRTPYWLAKDRGYSRIVERLRVAGAAQPLFGVLPYAPFNVRSTVLPPQIRKPIVKKMKSPTVASSENTTPSPAGLKASLTGPSCLDSPHSDPGPHSSNSSSELGSPGYLPSYTLHPLPIPQAGMRPSPPYDQDPSTFPSPFPSMNLPPLSLTHPNPPSCAYSTHSSYPQYPSYPHSIQPPACAFQNQQ